MVLTRQLVIATALAAVIAAPRAEAYLITDSTANQGGQQFFADNVGTGFDPGGAGAITATFNYSGPLTFSNTASQNSNSNGDLNSAFFDQSFISGYTSSGPTLGSMPGSSLGPNANATSALRRHS